MKNNPTTHLKNELLELHRTLGWMDLVIGSINDGVYVTDEKMNIIFANQCFADLIGLPRVFLLGQKVTDVFDVKLDLKTTADMGYHPTASGETVGIYTWKNKIDQKIFKISKRVLPTTKQSVFLAQDISQEQELSNMKSIFINLASHQLRTPMTSIMLYSHLLVDIFSEHHDPKQKELIDKILKSSERMTKLINDILIITKFQNDTSHNAEINKINFDEIIEVIKREVSPLANPKKLAINFEYDESIDKFYSTKSALQEILSNLMVNAVQYTPKKGSIHMKVLGDNETITINVTDSGIGIPENMLPYIFDQFSRADNAFEVHNEGTGLGLYLVKLLVMRLGGTITCDSTINSGTTFIVKLPSLSATVPTKPISES